MADLIDENRVTAPKPYQPKVNDKRQVVGTLPGGVDYCLDPPTNQTLISLEKIVKEHAEGSKIRLTLLMFELLSNPQIPYERLVKLDGESTGVMAEAIALFPVLR